MYERLKVDHLPWRLRLAGYADAFGLTRLAMSVRAHVPRRELTVVQYHRVAGPEDIGAGDTDLVDASPEVFAEHLRFFRRYFVPVSLDMVREARAGGEPLPQNPLLVTFDDGYLDNYTRATPLLQRFGIRAVFFVATDYLAANRLFWWDRIALVIRRARGSKITLSYPKPQEWASGDDKAKNQAIRAATRLVKDSFALDLDRFLRELTAACGVPWSEDEEAAAARQIVMGWEEARGMVRAGMDVQSHTRSHRVLASVPDEQLSDELLGSRSDIEKHTGQVCDTIAYPVGRIIVDQPRLRKAVADAGYQLGFTNQIGINPVDGSIDPFDWKRLRIDGDMPVAVTRGIAAFPWLGA